MEYIEFPNMFGGLKFAVNPVAFSIFGLEIYWYGIIMATSFLVAALLAIKQSKKFGFDEQQIIDLTLFCVPAGIIGARLYYVVFNLGQFKENLLSIFNTRTGGLAIYGALIFGIAAACIFAKVRNISILKLLDFGIISVAVAQAIGRWGNFINQEAFGTNTLLPWGMTGDKIKYEIYSQNLSLQQHGVSINPNIPVHPTFLYESLWSLFTVLILVWFRKRKKYDGEVFLLYLIIYGIGRFWIEWLRADSLWLGSFRVSQLLSAIIVLCSATMMYNIRKQKFFPFKPRRLSIEKAEIQDKSEE